MKLYDNNAQRPKAEAALVAPKIKVTSKAGTLLLLAMLFVSGGATCTNRRRVDDLFQPPVVFDNNPTKEQLIESINRSLAIQKIRSLNIKVSSPEIATRLRGTFTWERPLNFSFSASPGSMVFGEVIAAGSNNQTFWLKTQYPPPTRLVYASYEEFENQVGPRHILPVSPIWIREALGIIEFDPRDFTQMSAPRPDGNVELTTVIRSGQRLYTRTIVVEPKHVVISEVRLEDGATKRLIAQANLSEHSNYGAVGVNLPNRIDISLHPDSGPTLAFTIEIGQYAINDGEPADPASFAIPDTTGASVHDLVKINESIASAGRVGAAGRVGTGYGPPSASNGSAANVGSNANYALAEFQQPLNQRPAATSGMQNNSLPSNPVQPNTHAGVSSPRYTPVSHARPDPLQNVRR